MIDVSQVLKFPSSKFYFLKQLPVTNITHISTLKLTLNRNRLFGGGCLMEGGICLRYPSLRCKNYRNLIYSLTKSSFHIMVFNEKIIKIKAFDAYPALETCGVFLDNR